MYRLICQKPAHFLSAQMALVSIFFQMFIVLGMYNFDKFFDKITKETFCKLLTCNSMSFFLSSLLCISSNPISPPCNKASYLGVHVKYQHMCLYFTFINISWKSIYLRFIQRAPSEKISSHYVQCSTVVGTPSCVKSWHQRIFFLVPFNMLVLLCM